MSYEEDDTCKDQHLCACARILGSQRVIQGPSIRKAVSEEACQTMIIPFVGSNPIDGSPLSLLLSQIIVRRGLVKTGLPYTVSHHHAQCHLITS